MSQKGKYQNIVKLLAFILLLSNEVKAQIYNYDPIRHNNFETNPSYLASDKYKLTASYIHHGSLYQKNKFYYDAAKASVYFQKCFTGVGITINNTYVNNAAKFTYVGLGAAYRTVLFNKIYTKIGFMYKLTTISSPPGYFDFYSFKKNGDGERKQTLIKNANVSVSFSSGREKYYLSVGILNVNLEKKTNDTVGYFPLYYFLNIGDFAKMLDLENWEMSYTVFTKKYSKQKAINFNHYLTVLYSGFHISRSSSIRCGVRVGNVDNYLIQIDPVISFYHRTHKRKFIVYQLLYDFAIPLKSKKESFKPALQFNLTYLF